MVRNNHIDTGGGLQAATKGLPFASPVELISVTWHKPVDFVTRGYIGTPEYFTRSGPYGQRLNIAVG